MLSVPLNLAGQGDPAVYGFLYPYFHRDFVAARTYLNGTIFVDPAAHGYRDGKEEIFWHITTREKEFKVKRGGRMQTVKQRLFDSDRSARIEWVKQIINNHSHPDIRLFYRKETKGKKPIRMYLWAYQHDFVVIVQKLGQSDAYLVTSFYITETYKRNSYQAWYNDYLSGTNPELAKCGWF
jgi:hypothetical protein